MPATQKKNIKNKVALITGGGSGIGRATARLFAREGASVVLMGRRKAPLTRVARQISKQGGKALAIKGDVTDEQSVHRVIQAALKDFKKIDILVNSAGTAGEAALVHETTDQMWEELIDSNLTGTFRMIRAILPHFMEKRKGVIVNIASIAALAGFNRMAAYSVAKSGVVALTKSIAVEYGHLGIRCNCICPGTVETNMTKDYLSYPGVYDKISATNPLNRISRADEIARGIFYLGSEESSFVTGAVLTVDGGFTAG
ncbi:MAG: SDR family oxidoreductase [Deltaproteobacteria bacterium]|nr:SDR family oxidoreductase [Deltaproteobacteria bacterium]MBW2051121.1 SDR family oxidoreductase [Deltaproteobacteria bacterium]MBW2141403.1 SDR family oxidoreductase [Deltaproteobacteria bacterium]MBW2322865.1 SDR family oxidoreductase [Deltaproteobacteria bacterium]